MAPLPHIYDVTLTGGREGYCTASAPGLTDLRTAPPVQFGGPGDAWSPEHLLLASVATCFVLTFRAVARAGQMPFQAIDVRATGTVAKQAGAVRFTEIVIQARISVAAGADRERLIELVAKTEDRCLVSASLSTPVRVEPEVVETDAGGDSTVGLAIAV
jgi:peroxiredoxin-like protein